VRVYYLLLSFVICESGLVGWWGVVFGYVLDLLAIIFIFVIKLRGLCGLTVAMLLWLFCWLCCGE